MPEGTGGSSSAFLGDIQLTAATSSATEEVMGSNNYSVVVLKVQEGKTLAGSYSADSIRNIKYRSSEVTNITITSGVSSAGIGQNNVAVSTNGSSWQDSIPAADLRRSAQEASGGNSDGNNPSGETGSSTDNSSGTGW